MEAANTYSSWPEFLDIIKNANKDSAELTTNHNNNNNNNKIITNSGSRSGSSSGSSTILAGVAEVTKYRPKRGVVDECCKKPCTYITLGQYCGI